MIQNKTGLSVSLKVVLRQLLCKNCCIYFLLNKYWKGLGAKGPFLQFDSS